MGYKYPSEEGGETDEKEKDKRKSVQYWDRWNEEMEDTVDRYQVVLKRDYNPDTKGIYIIDPPEQYKEISFENITPSRRVRSITIRSFHIEGIHGLEALKNWPELWGLDIVINPIRKLDLAPLIENKNLRCINLGYNMLESLNLEFVKELTSLKILRLNHNQLTNLDLRPLATCTSLEQLSVETNNIKRLELQGALENKPKLRTIELGPGIPWAVEGAYAEWWQNKKRTKDKRQPKEGGIQEVIVPAAPKNSNPDLKILYNAEGRESAWFPDPPRITFAKDSGEWEINEEKQRGVITIAKS